MVRTSKIIETGRAEGIQAARSVTTIYYLIQKKTTQWPAKRRIFTARNQTPLR